MPLNSHVLRRYLALREENPPPCSIRKLLTLVLDELLSKFWIPSRIPTKDEKECLDNLQKLVKQLDTVRKWPHDRRQRHFDDFNAKLNSLCDLSHRNVEQLLRSSGSPSWRIDLEFLHGQRETPQRGIMQGNDCVLANKEKIQEEKRLKLQVRREKEKQRRSETLSTVAFPHKEKEQRKDNDADYVAPSSKNKRKKEKMIEQPQ